MQVYSGDTLLRLERVVASSFTLFRSVGRHGRSEWPKKSSHRKMLSMYAVALGRGRCWCSRRRGRLLSLEGSLSQPGQATPLLIAGRRGPGGASVVDRGAAGSLVRKSFLQTKHPSSHYRQLHILPHHTYFIGISIASFLPPHQKHIDPPFLTSPPSLRHRAAFSCRTRSVARTPHPPHRLSISRDRPPQ